MFDAKKFRAKIVEKGSSLKQVAAILGCDESTLSRKINGKSDFTRNEIQLFMQAFNLTMQEVEAIFFAPIPALTQVLNENQ